MTISGQSSTDDCYLSVLCPVLKKVNPSVSTKYRGISLIPIAYKVLSSVLCKRLKPILAKLSGRCQCGFRSGKCTNDQIFTLRQILEKTDRHLTSVHDFGIRVKLIELCAIKLTNTKSSETIGKNLTMPFSTKRSLDKVIVCLAISLTS